MSSVVVARLKEIDPFCPNHIHDSMLLGDTSRPDVRAKVLERLWLADADKRVAHDRLDELQDAEGNASIRLNPVAQIVTKLGLKDGLTGGRARS
jgi:hypothetical protein